MDSGDSDGGGGNLERDSGFGNGSQNGDRPGSDVNQNNQSECWPIM